MVRARVVDDRAWGNVEFYPQARVSFTTDAGETVVTWVSTDSRHTRGETPEVRYSRSSPRTARVVGEEFPHRDDWRVPAIMTGAGLALSVGTIALAEHEWRIWLGY